MIKTAVKRLLLICSGGVGAAIAWAIGLQAAVLLLALGIGIVAPVLRQEKEFVAPTDLRLPQKQVRKKADQAEFKRAVGAPVPRERLSTAVMLPGSLPTPPPLTTAGASELMARTVPSQMASLLGQSGIMGAMGGMPGQNSEVNFFGIKDQASRIVILVDVSASVQRKVEQSGGSMAEVREETRRLIQGLNANTLFGVIQFSRRYQGFRDYLVSATQTNKQSAEVWLDKSFRVDGRSGSNWKQGSPDGVQSVLQEALALDPAPDLIILLSDGSFQRSRGGGGEDVPWADIDRIFSTMSSGRKAPRLHFVGFRMDASDRAEVIKLTRRMKGQFREF